MIKVLVNGASGRMGSEVVRSIEKEEGLILCGAVDPKCTGQDIGDVVGIGYKGIQIYGSLEEAFVSGKPDVVVDFTSPKVIYSNAQTVCKTSSRENNCFHTCFFRHPFHNPYDCLMKAKSGSSFIFSRDFFP